MGYLMGYPWLEAWSPKPTQSRGIESQPSRTPLTLELGKTPKSSSLTHGFGREIKGKRTTKGSHEFPPIKSPRARSRKHTEKTTKRGPRKSPPRTTGNNTIKP
jgi:hypothetical protein